MQPDNLLSEAVVTLLSGGKEALYRPPRFSCADQTHEPFRLRETPLQFTDAGPFLWGCVRTTSWQFDGDRTDVHDIFSLVWAMLLRAFGLSSPWLIDEPNAFGASGELSARHVVLQQCPWRISEEHLAMARRSMNAWTAFGYHLLDDVFTWCRLNLADRPYFPSNSNGAQPSWAPAVLRYLHQPRDVIITRRRYPFWIYLASHAKGVTIVRMPRIRLGQLKQILAPYHPSAVKGESALAIVANGLQNAIPYKTIEQVRKLLRYVGDPCKDLVLLPIDSHCIALADKTLIAVRADCGRDIFERERAFLMNRRSLENRVFFSDCTIEWKL